MDAGDLNEISDRGAFEGLSAADYRTAAARAQRLHAQATTPRLKQYLVEVIARCERLAGETESTAKKDLAEADRGPRQNGPRNYAAAVARNRQRAPSTG
jgi:hypothetical protein